MIPHQQGESEMLFYPNERLALFIDGPNFLGIMKSLKLEVDYVLLRKYFAGKGRLLRCNYYTAIRDTQDFDSVRRLTDFLAYNGFSVVSKAVKEMTNQATGVVTRKGNMDVDITIDMLKLAPHLDHLILFSGDGDFRALVEELQGMGKRVSVVATTKGTPATTADDLRRQPDNFIELDDIRADVAREPTHRESAAATL
jgi:uncharacterized LabA/DUF88 family protein